VFPKLYVARKLLLWTALAVVYSAVVTLLVTRKIAPTWSLADDVAAGLTALLGIQVVFRNNAANDRWWEARKLWGQLINDTRNMALKARAYANLDGAERADFGRLLIGFAHALRMHLRGSCALRSVPGFSEDSSTFPHAPGYVAGLVFESVDRWEREGKLHTSVWLVDRHAGALMDICGACERIRNTPLASSYRALLRWTIALDLVLAPWGAAEWAGWLSLPLVATGTIFLLGVELAAEAIEEPFGTSGDDLPLEKYCETIETFVRAALCGDDKDVSHTPRVEHVKAGARVLEM